MQDKVNILVVMGSPYSRTPALLRAMSLALKMDATLMLYSFEYERSLAHAVKHGFDLEAYIKGRGRELEDFADELRGEGFSVKTRVVWGNHVASRIVTAALAVQPDYVIKDVHTEKSLRKILFTSIDWQLLRECPAPLMLVRPHTGNTPHRIMAAVDPLDEHDRPRGLNDVIVKFAAMFGMQTDAQVDVVHAFDYVPVLAAPEGFGGEVLDARIFDELRATHRDALKALGEKYGVQERHLHLLDGKPEVVLADFAREFRIDMVVMGTIYRSRFERLAMGSTAEGLLDNLDCDVLALKPDGFREQLMLLLENTSQEAA